MDYGALVDQLRRRPEFGAGALTVYCATVGGRGISGVLPHGIVPTRIGTEFGRMLDRLVDQEHRDGHSPIWATLRVDGSTVDLHLGFDEPIPDWIPIDPDFDINQPTMWLIQWRKFDKRPPHELPQFWKDKLAEIGAWDAEHDTVAIDQYGNPLYGPPRFDKRGRVL